MFEFLVIARAVDQLERGARSRSADRGQLDQALRDSRKACCGHERPLA